MRLEIGEVYVGDDWNDMTASDKLDSAGRVWTIRQDSWDENCVHRVIHKVHRPDNNLPNRTHNCVFQSSNSVVLLERRFQHPLTDQLHYYRTALRSFCVFSCDVEAFFVVSQNYRPWVALVGPHKCHLLTQFFDSLLCNIFPERHFLGETRLGWPDRLKR